jgi:hypothetical protein
MFMALLAEAGRRKEGMEGERRRVLGFWLPEKMLRDRRAVCG